MQNSLLAGGVQVPLTRIYAGPWPDCPLASAAGPDSCPLWLVTWQGLPDQRLVTYSTTNWTQYRATQLCIHYQYAKPRL